MTMEIFKDKKGRLSGIPFVSIHKHGAISLSKYAVKQYLNGEKFCVLGYDKEKDEICIVVSTIKEHYYSFIITYLIDGSCSISARNFLKHFAINHDKCRRYENIKKEGDMITISLNSQAISQIAGQG